MIKKEELELIKQTDMVALVTNSGVKLTSKGNDFVGLCPFHNDKTPSLVITPKKNLLNCLGACTRGGGHIDRVMRKQGVEFKEAAKILRKLNGALFSSLAESSNASNSGSS